MKRRLLLRLWHDWIRDLREWLTLYLNAAGQDIADDEAWTIRDVRTLKGGHVEKFRCKRPTRK